MSARFSEWLGKLWKPIAVFLSAAGTIFQFVQLLRGESQTVGLIIGGMGLVVLLALLVYVGCSREESQIEPGEYRMRYPEWYRRARIGLRIVLTLVLLGGTLLLLQRADRRIELKQKIVVLVADFYSTEPDEFLITELVLSGLRTSLDEFDDTMIVALGAPITEQDGPSGAEAIGQTHFADLVWWGSYGVTVTDVKVILHVENLGGSEILSPEDREPVHIHGSLAEINNFEIQGKLTTVVTTLTLYVSGISRYKAMDYGQCVERLSQVLDDDTGDEVLVSKVALFVYLGNCHLQNGNYEKALESFKNAVERGPESAKAYYGRGLVYYYLGEYEQAVEDNSRAIELDPQYADAYINRGIARASLGEREGAIADYHQAIELEPKNEKALYNRGILHYRSGDYSVAIADYSAAIQIDRKNAKAYYGRGLAHYHLEEYEQAVEDNSRAIEIDSQDADAYVNRGLAYAGLDNHERAIADYGQAIELEPQNEKAFFSRGTLHYRLGDYSQAIEDYSAAIQIDSTNARAFYGRGLAYYQLGEYEEAVEDNSRAIEIDPQYADAYVNRGIALNSLSDHALAIEDYSRALEIDSMNVKAYYNRGLAYEALGEIQQATADFRELLEISDDADLRERAAGQLRRLEDVP